ncbi:transposase [Patescibacteria group bacterium]|nr:transposase [Patescibacteria group bacterium]
MKKKILLNQIKRATKNYSASDIIFSIASNHYHLKCHSKNDTDLAKIKQIINGGTSYEYRKSFKMKYQEMWQCTKSLQVTSDDMDWRVTGYIIGNLLKHKEVNTFQELRDNPFSSYRQIDDKYGEEFAR